MLFINDKFELELNISQGEFIDKFLKITEIREDVEADIFPNKKKDFLGSIDYNSFLIILNKSSFLRNNYKIKGKIINLGAKVQINCTIIGYKLLLLFVICFTLFSFSGLIAHLFFINGKDDLNYFFIILTFIGFANIIGGIRGLKNYEKQFIGKIIEIENK